MSSNSRGKRPTDPAKEAAALAEWSSKTRVWVPDEQEGFVAGWIVKEEGDVSTVALESGEQLRQVSSLELSRINPPAFDGAADIADLTYLNEASVVHNLRTRYSDSSIYTYSGLFLVAVNPYRSLPLYTPNVVAQYKRSRREANPPHVFAVAEQAWQRMTAHGESQSVLVTGESGAGKTETTKKVIQYLAAIAADPSLPASASFDRLAQAEAHTRLDPHLGQLEKKIIEANPILEAFGNAQTMRNDNSSRFGKFVRIFFNAPGAIVGANIDWYLLEKSRVTARTAGERNYHVFYQLLRGADATLKRQLLLEGSAKDYEYLKRSADTVNGVDDREEWALLQDALAIVGFSPAEQVELFKILAAILHLGNISVAGSEQAHLVDRSQVEKVAFLLGLDDSDLSNALIRPKVKAGREWVTQARTPKQVVDELAAMSKALYERMFGAIVERVNKALGRPVTKTFIGVLDIAGFEIFETNGFEQLLINLTNEKLQQFFNHQAFVLEQEEYAREEISWEFVNFGLELQPTIDLIESNNPMGILSCLDDETFMPKGSDKKLTEKLDGLAKTHATVPSYSKYTPSRLEQGFTVSHYAGDVEYRTDGWLGMNKDPLNDNLTSLLAKSSDHYVSGLFSDYVDPEAVAEGPRTRVRKGAFRTVGQRHKEQLTLLMGQLNATQPHFIRCIVPNAQKSPSHIDVPLVLTQLRCNGVLEGIRIARIGYPNRLPFAEFRRRFGILAPSLPPKSTFIEGNEACSTILTALDLDPQCYRLGLTKVFFKAGILAELEGRRDDRLADIVTRLQATCRKFVGRRKATRILHRAAAVEMIQRNARIYIALRRQPWWALFQTVRPHLAAARSDGELRRKEEELAAANKRMEEEAAERERLVKEQAESDARRRAIEEQLASELLKLEEKDAKIEQGRVRVLELEEQLAGAQADVETADRHIDQLIALRKATEEQIAHLTSSDEHQRHLITTLQAEQIAWKAKEVELASQTSVKTAEWERIVSERDQGVSAVEELKRKLSEEGQDRRREERRLADEIASLSAQLASASKQSTDSRQQLKTLETEKHRATEESTGLKRQKQELEAVVVSKGAELARLSSDLVALTRARDASASETDKLKSSLANVTKELEEQRRTLASSETSRLKTVDDLVVLKKLLNDRSTEQERTNELNKLQEAEVRTLQQQLKKVTTELDLSHRDSQRTVDRLHQDVSVAQRDVADLKRKNDSLEQRATTSTSELLKLRAQVESLEQDKQAHDLKIEILHQDFAETTLKEREEWKRKVAEADSRSQRFEDDAIERGRERDAVRREVKSLESALLVERSNVAAEEKARKAAEAQSDQQHIVLASMDKIIADLRAELSLTKKDLDMYKEQAGRTVVEHIRVQEEALRKQGLQMEDLRKERLELQTRVKFLERARREAADDAQHQRDAASRQAWQARINQPAPDTTVDRLKEELASEKKIRQLAEVNVVYLQSEIRLVQSQHDAARADIDELKRQKARLERDITAIAASDHTESITAPRGTMRDSRVVNSLPLSSYPQRVSLPAAAKPSPSPLAPQSPRRRNYE